MRLRKRLRKVTLGNLGDIKPVADGVWEMREFFGPGWRMYYVQQGEVLIVMLGGVTSPPNRSISQRLLHCPKPFERVLP